jgi:RimJ/RimL family protein N-acetyltransferase
VITFERSADFNLIHFILTHKRVYPHISDDHSPPAEEYQPIEHPAVWYVIAQDVDPKLSQDVDSDEGPDTLGLWMFHPLNGICWEVHTALLPCAWGDVGLEAARQLPAWIWENTPCRRIVTNVPATNRLALHFAINAGMRVFGVNPASWLKDGKLCDQICLGISPQEMACREAETGRHAIEREADALRVEIESRPDRIGVGRAGSHRYDA